MSLLLFFSASSSATTFKLATGEFSPYTGEKIKDQGISTKIIISVFRDMKQDITLEFMPWNRVMNKLRHNLIAGSFPWIMSDERKEFLIYSTPLHKFRIVHFIKSDSKLTFTKDLQKKVMCLPKAWEDEMYQGMIAKYNLTVVRPILMESCFRMLEKNRVDFISDDENIGKQVIERLYPRDSPFKIVISPFFPKTFSYHFVVPKKYPDAEKIINSFNISLKRVMKKL